VHIGIVGVITEEALSVTVAANTDGLRIAPIADTIETAATRLRADGASVVVVASHAGGNCTSFTTPTDLSSCDLSEEIVRVARSLPPDLVDVIVAGHSHDTIGHQIAGVATSEAHSAGRAFGRVDLIVDRASKRVLERRSFAPRDLCARVDSGTTNCGQDVAGSARVTAEYEGAPVAPDPAIAKVIAPAVEAAVELKGSQLGVTLETPIRVADPDKSPLGNLFTDAYLAAVPGADVAINNTDGGLRTDLPAGPLTYGAVFEVMPFDNRVVAFHLTGAELRIALETQLRAGAPLVGIAGLRARATCRGGTIDVALLRPSGARVADANRLLVATTDFLAAGGDRIFDPVRPPKGFAIVRDVGGARDIVVEMLRKRGGTLREDDLIEAANPRWVLPGPQPVTCR
jgi:5'-nucleotidase